MKKLAILASITFLLCASASFAKKALDEEEMDLVTAAGQPTVIDIKAEADGTSSAVTSDTKADVYASANTTSSGSASISEVDAEGFSGEVNADIESLFPPNLEGDIQVNFADAEIESFSLSGSGSLTATSSVESETEIELGATASVDATTEDNSNWSLLVNSGSQENLRALALNNVVGENQLANAFNVEAGASSTSGTQANTINQSWGATYDWSFAPGVDAGEGKAGGDGGDIATMAGSCVFGPCNDASGGDGGDGGDAAPAVPLTITGDKIIRVEAESENGDVEVDAHEIDKSLVSAIIDTDSQSNLAALAVNNVVGRNQVATGVNVASNGGTFVGSSNTTALVAFDSTQSGKANFGGSQSNTINQYRGTPFQQ